ncbi:MAG: ABC transporter ATP-binding protein [Aeromicrobium erythreum]
MSRELLPVADRRGTLAVARRVLAPHRTSLLLSTVSFTVVGAAGAVVPFVLGRIVDVVRTDGPESAIRSAVVVIAVAAVVGGLAAAAAQAFLARAAAPALATLRELVLDRALHLPSARLERAGAGDVLSRVGDDVRNVTESIDEAVPLLVNSVVAIAFTAVGLGALDWRLGLAGLAAIPLYALGLRWYLPRSGPYYRRERTAEGERAQALVNGIQGATTLRAFGREEHGVRRIADTSRVASGVTLDVFALLTRFGARTNRSEAIALLLVLSTGYWLVAGDHATVGAASAAALYFHRLFNPIGAVLYVFDEVQSAGASLSRLAGVALLPATAPAVVATDPAHADLRIHGLTHAYEADRPVLHDVDLVVAPGEQVALVGSTGAGKTTLALVAAGHLEATQGAVELGDRPLDAATARRHVGVVSQEVHLFAGTVRDNLLLARGDADDDAVWDALATAHAADWVRRLPDGLDTDVRRTDVTLGAAQVQQLALARIALLDPLVVVLDEATAEAGSAGAQALEEAAADVVAGRTAVVVAHRLSQAARADRVVVMEHGRVVEDGPHEDLVAAGGRYAALWSAWSSPT